ncbi:hypothetical protein [Terrimonas ferruginea]|uniref:hypothetical protein n=1 Tax=Terrimonas ferruginea TaxID=249 RepID=UPI000686F90F|nr:hypothetical protein [Terrimonas ferruginea]
MKYLFLITVLFVLACNNEKKEDKNQPVTEVAPGPVAQPAKEASDSMLAYIFADSVVKALNNRDLVTLASFVHPEKGVRFSPYGFVDTSATAHFTTQDLQKAKMTDVHNWGDFDGSGDPIKFTIERYFRRFVINANYLRAPKRSYNNFLTHGSSLNNLKEVYPSAMNVEYFYPGFDKKYEGMDWSCLRIVMEPYNGRLRLVAVVHDEWTV